MTLSDQQKKLLLKIARTSIEAYVKIKKTYEIEESDPQLTKIQGAFVSIHKKGALRGCIGNIIGEYPLYLTVRNMAIAAASQDFRFNPISAEELSSIDLEISVLSVPKQIASIEEIVMGTHGVIAGESPYQGVFLPQVATQTGWSKEEFLSHLCSEKAGLPANTWKDPKTIIKIFSAEVFSEKQMSGDS